jgi:tRNA(Leu) C34 or U34 (ribose-2'-O)-methylase TrmL
MAGRGFAAIGLVNPKTPENVGSVLRAAGGFEAALVVIAGNRPNYYLHRMRTDPQKSHRRVPLLHVTNVFDAVPFDCMPIAVDLVPTAKSLIHFVHPERGYYIFGPEDGTLGRAVTDRCAVALMVPTALCMNLAACVNVVLYDRLAKQLMRTIGPSRNSEGKASGNAHAAGLVHRYLPLSVGGGSQIADAPIRSDV